MARVFVALIAAFFLIAPVPAQEQPDEDRYALVPLKDGLMRLDKKSGEVSQCSDVSGPLTCRLLPDERMAYQAEIDRLTGRLDRVEREVAALRETPPAATDVPETLPSDEEIERYMGFAEQVMRRFFDMVREFKGHDAPEEL